MHKGICISINIPSQNLIFAIAYSGCVDFDSYVFLFVKEDNVCVLI